MPAYEEGSKRLFTVGETDRITNTTMADARALPGSRVSHRPFCFLLFSLTVTVQLGQNDSPVTIVSGDIQKDQF
jgi:hypothetical protein